MPTELSTELFTELSLESTENYHRENEDARIEVLAHRCQAAASPQTPQIHALGAVTVCRGSPMSTVVLKRPNSEATEAGSRQQKAPRFEGLLRVDHLPF